MRTSKIPAANQSDEIWHKLWCPHCEAKNWVYDGRHDDCTTGGYDGATCHACKKPFWLNETMREEKVFEWEDDEDENSQKIDIIEEAYLTKGAASPS